MLIRFTKYNSNTDEHDKPISDWFDVDQSQIDLFISAGLPFEEQPTLQLFIDKANKIIADREKYRAASEADSQKRKAATEARKRKMLEKLKAELGPE